MLLSRHPRASSTLRSCLAAFLRLHPTTLIQLLRSSHRIGATPVAEWHRDTAHEGGRGTKTNELMSLNGLTPHGQAAIALRTLVQGTVLFRYNAADLLLRSVATYSRRTLHTGLEGKRRPSTWGSLMGAIGPHCMRKPGRRLATVALNVWSLLCRRFWILFTDG